MSDTSPRSFYNNKIGLFTDQIGSVQKKLSFVALLRLASFIALALSTYFLVTAFDWLLMIPGLLSFVGFVLLIRWNWQLKDKRDLLEKLLSLNTNELAVLNDQPNSFADGQDFLTQDGYLDDLDIFGIRSLFHLLNRTTTTHGLDRLATLLKQPMQSGPEIKSQQDGIRILAGQTEKRQLIIAHGMLTGEKEGNLHDMTGWLAMPPLMLEKKWVLVFRWLIPAFNSAALLLWLVNGNYRPIVIGVMAGWILNGYFSKYFAQQIELLSKKGAILEQYALILQLFNNMDSGKAPLLEQLQMKAAAAHSMIRKLSGLSSYFDRQLNPMISFFLNNLFAYNLNGVVTLEKWRRTNKEAFPHWIEAVGHIECLHSLAGFAFNNPEYIYPSPQSPQPPPSGSASPSPNVLAGGSSLFIRAEQLAHPLIPATERVANDLLIGQNDRLILVTGSNMSGKTTFLRTLGVNILLAQCGAPVCAASFSFTPMHILSSLRVSDSLREHTSYFMAELKKLQQIVHGLQSGLPALVLVDEILRGTNSEDKTYGSERFIHRLLEYSCLSLFATHDLSLGRLEAENPGLVSNYCFESVIGDGELHFDYRLQRGIARNRNASFLMGKMEII